jgi:outer membrane immunogenic protein
MKRLFLSCAAAAGLMAGPALAADLPESYEQPVAPEVYGPTVFNWTGPYVGAQIGYSWGGMSGRYPSGRATIDKDGIAGGLYGGYNYQVMPNVVIGAEGDITWADLQGSRNIGGRHYKARTDWDGTIRARAGAAFDRFLVYGTGGIAFADNKLEAAGRGSQSKTQVGWAVGAGVEGAITENIVARAEYLYQGFGNESYGKLNVRDADFDINVVRAGVGYKF